MPSGRSGGRYEKTPAIILLIGLGNLLVCGLGIALVLLGSITPIPQLVCIIISITVFILHIVCSVNSQIRFKSRYGISEGRYILYSALPSPCVSAAAFLAGMIRVCAADSPGDSTLMTALGLPLISFMYSALYCIILAVILEKREDKEPGTFKSQ